jgi:two-component system response regulator YesN
LLTILLVDDEPLARSDIRSHFPWQQWGCEIIGETASGVEALAFCETAIPDIALVDITMPVMDGLTLLELLKQKYPNLQVIILTAHRDFSFAQKAIQKGAAGYILKSSFNMDETKEALERARQEIAKQHAIGENLLFQQQVIQNYRYPIRKQFFEDILTGLITDQGDILRKASSIGIDIQADSYVMLVCTVDELASFMARYREEDYSLVQFSLLEIIRELLFNQYGNQYDMFPTTFGRCAILLKSNNPDHTGWPSTHLAVLIDELNGTLLKLMKITVSLVASEPFSMIRQLKDKYKTMLRFTEHRYYQKKPLPIIMGHSVAFRQTLPADFEGLYVKFQEIIQSQDERQLVKWLAQVLHSSLDFKPEPALVRQWLTLLLQVVESQATDELATDWPAFHQISNLHESLEQLRLWLIAWWDMLAKVVRTRPEIALAIQYIKKHLDTDLSQETVANKVELSPAYLGRIFKRDMGISMTDYITEQRIQLAKKHLVDGTYRNYELAEKIGFTSYSYFCTIFKKVTGQTPNEYKNSQFPVQTNQ